MINSDRTVSAEKHVWVISSTFTPHFNFPSIKLFPPFALWEINCYKILFNFHLCSSWAPLRQMMPRRTLRYGKWKSSSSVLRLQEATAPRWSRLSFVSVGPQNTSLRVTDLVDFQSPKRSSLSCCPYVGWRICVYSLFSLCSCWT